MPGQARPRARSGRGRRLLDESSPAGDCVRQDAFVRLATRDTVEFYSGGLARFVNERLKPMFGSSWFVRGGAVSGECLRLGLADEVRYSILPILIGEGIPFFEGLEQEVALHLVEVKAHASGMVALRHEVRK